MSEECAGGSCGEGDGGSKESRCGNGGSEERGVIQGRNVECRGGKSGTRQGGVESVFGIDGRSVKVIVDENVPCCGGIEHGGTGHGGEIDGGTR